jgi:hypothetical protein
MPRRAGLKRAPVGPGYNRDAGLFPPSAINQKMKDDMADALRFVQRQPARGPSARPRQRSVFS